MPQYRPSTTAADGIRRHHSGIELGLAWASSTAWTVPLEPTRLHYRPERLTPLGPLLDHLIRPREQ